MRSLRSVLAFCALIASPCSLSGQLPPPSKAYLRAGDALEITVWRRPELSGTFRILSDGSLEHPLYANVSVANRTIEEARQEIATLLLDYESEPRFVIAPKLRVAVGGEVRQPNLYSLAPEMTVAQAVAAAGGVMPNARLDRVRLLRDGVEYRIDLTRGDDALATMQIRSGDRIFVDRKVSVWREYIAPAGSILAAVVSLLNFAF